MSHSSREKLILSPKSRAFLRCNAPVEFLEGTTAAGKTTVGIFKFFLKIARSPKKYHIIAARNTGTAEKNIINKDLGIIDDFGVLTEYHGKFFKSSRWNGRGKSIFDDKCDSFDALDECWSQWIDALRKGRTKEYIPENMLPRDPRTGEVMQPNPFDNAYIATQSVMVEGVAPHIETVQPSIPVESYLGTYITALDLCLQGLISPSTLGIDVKKLDNAEAQREKEKATLYTRNSIVATLQSTLPALIDSLFKAYDTFYKRPVSGIADKVEIPFGEYANPSFESQVETCGKARQFGLMSVETMLDELYGDTRTAEWKASEAVRIKAEQGLTQEEEPSLLADLIGAGAANA